MADRLHLGVTRGPRLCYESAISTAVMALDGRRLPVMIPGLRGSLNAPSRNPFRSSGEQATRP